MARIIAATDATPGMYSTGARSVAKLASAWTTPGTF